MPCATVALGVKKIPEINFGLPRVVGPRGRVSLKFMVSPKRKAVSSWLLALHIRLLKFTQKPS